MKKIFSIILVLMILTGAVFAQETALDFLDRAIALAAVPKDGQNVVMTAEYDNLKLELADHEIYKNDSITNGWVSVTITQKFKDKIKKYTMSAVYVDDNKNHTYLSAKKRMSEKYEEMSKTLITNYIFGVDEEYFVDWCQFFKDKYKSKYSLNTDDNGVPLQIDVQIGVIQPSNDN
ncbi:hypothetical protein [Treponema sp. C6A8]|uniref:hypothetical protein n=1 Tax=Treponema sp. C6A8 TaxID=1410609 RepID=UPI0004830373|nr:hypothetical protein [Treponema sp. C6A8]